MNIGKESPAIIIEPIEIPVPGEKRPAPAEPNYEPAPKKPAKEPAPA